MSRFGQVGVAQRNKPQYAIDSVDHALHLATLLQQEGPMGISAAAGRPGVSRSTAHRLLAMLVYRDFAEQGLDRRYRAGPVLWPAGTTAAPVERLRRVAPPHMRALVARVGETANLLVLAGTGARFIESVECEQVLRVGALTRAAAAISRDLAETGGPPSAAGPS